MRHLLCMRTTLYIYIHSSNCQRLLELPYIPLHTCHTSFSLKIHSGQSFSIFSQFYDPTHHPSRLSCRTPNDLGCNLHTSITKPWMKNWDYHTLEIRCNTGNFTLNNPVNVPVCYWYEMYPMICRSVCRQSVRVILISYIPWRFKRPIGLHSLHSERLSPKYSCTISLSWRALLFEGDKAC